MPVKHVPLTNQMSFDDGISDPEIIDTEKRRIIVHTVGILLFSPCQEVKRK